MKGALIFLCVLRIVGNAVWKEFECPAIYYITQAIFETGILIVLYKSFDGWMQRFLVFCAFASGFVLLREIVFLFSDWLGNPEQPDFPDRIGFWAGVAGLIFHEWRLWKKSKG